MVDSKLKARVNFGPWLNAQAFHKVNGKYEPFIIDSVYVKLRDKNNEVIADKDGNYIWVLAGK